MSLRQVAVGVCAAAVVLVSAACGSSASHSTATSSSGVFTELVIGGTTGVNEDQTQNMLLGLKAAVGYLNTKGGMDGHQIKIVILNDNGEGTTAVEDLLGYLSTHPAPNAVFAGVESEETAALLPVVASHKLFSIADNDGNNELSSDTDYPDSFSMVASPQLEAEATASWFKSHDISDVGILEESVAYEEGVQPVVAKEFQEEGLRLSTVQFPETATNLSSEVNQLKQSGAGGVFLLGFGPATGYLLSARTQLGWNVPVVCDLACSTLDLTTLTSPGQLKDVYEVALRAEASNQHLPGLTLFRQWVSKYGSLPGGQPFGLEAETWDGQLALAAAADQAKSISAAAMTAALEKLSPSGQDNPLYLNNSRYDFSYTDHDPLVSTSSLPPIVPAGRVLNGQIQVSTSS